MLNFYRSTVNHGTQNIQSDCHQWLSVSFRVHRIRFRPGLRPGPHGRAYSAPPDTLAGLRSPTSKGEGRKRGKREKKGRGRGREAPLPPFCIFLDPPPNENHMCITLPCINLTAVSQQVELIVLKGIHEKKTS